ncbi:MAG: TIGR00266 family protein [Prochloraceae cyanobacterium]|nr:TIGR00266 family protein [Prochloraceae cyanobacterium]
MDIEILHQPDSAIARVSLEPGEEVVAQAGAMVSMSGDMETETTLRRGKGGGIIGGLKRMLAGESLFLSLFRPTNQTAEVLLAPKLMGDIIVYEMKGQELVVQAASYLACASGVDIELGFTGFKSLLSGESIFWLVISGTGPVILTSFGSIYEVFVDGEYIVDTGHIVAFEKSLDYKISKPGTSWIGAFLGGEGFVCNFSGRGKVYCQTHNPGAFGQLIGSMLPPR